MKAASLILFSSAVFALSWFTSCSKLHSIDGNGNVTSDTRIVQWFDQIKSMGDYHVIVIQDSISKVVVEAESNLQPYIETEVNDHQLVIKTHEHRNIDNNYPIKIYVYTPDVTSIDLSGSGKIESDSISSGTMNIELSGSGDMDLNIFCSNLDTKVSGSGDITLAGTSTQSDHKISGSGKIHAYSMITTSCFADISGSGCMYINVTDFLDVNISGSGKVYYQGNPSVSTHITGSGSVINN